MQGTRVLDLSQSITGAYAARLLAGLGAEVTIGEPAGGSPLRQSPPLVSTAAGPRSASWEYLAAYKSSIVLQADDVETAAGHHDAVILASDGPAEPTGRMAERLRRLHPGVVVVAITPFGLAGPYSQWRAGPLELWAIGGHMMLNGEPDRQPIPGGGPWDSHLVGATAGLAAQAALIGARASGAGVLVDVGAMEVLASAHQWSISMFTHTGVTKRRTGNRHGEMHHPLALYQCLDGWVCIAAASFHQWEGLCVAMDHVELLADDDLANAADRFDRADELDRLVTGWTMTRTVDEVVRSCQEQFCPAGPVGELSDIVDDEQLEHRRYWVSAPHLGPDVVMPGVPFRLPCTPQFSPAPTLGSADAATGEPTPDDGGIERSDRSSRHTEPGDPGPADTVPTDPGPESSEPGPSGTRSETGFAPLAGLRVVELTISWAGPLAGRFLADLGAEVIKVEHPTSRGVAVTPPDPDAQLEPWEWGELPPTSVRNGIYPDADPGVEWWNRMSLWNKMNRSKRSLALDIKGPGGREVFERLVASADIVLNNYSPRGVRSLGLEPETLRALKPDLVTVSMSGYGATGPGSEAVSWGPILDAASGLAATTGYFDSGPYKQGLAYPDPVGGTHGASAVLAAWWEHLRTGEPVHVDLSQLETLLAIAGDQIIETTVNGHAPVRRGARSASYAPAGVYRCDGEDRWLALTVYDDADWRRLAAVIPLLDRPDWAAVADRHVHHDEIDELISKWTGRRPAHQAMALLQGAGLAATVATTNRDLVEDEHLEWRGFMVTVEQQTCGPRLYPGSPFLVDAKPLAIGPAPPLGGDNDRVTEELGFDADDRARLIESGTIATAPPA